MANINMVSVAREYRDRGLSVFPTRPQDKRPAVKWTEFQTRLATDSEIDSWFGEGSNYGIGIATGKLSDIVVVDVEAGGDISSYPKTVMSQTGGLGWHMFFKWPGIKIKNGEKVAELTDIRGDGGFVVVPPTVHPSGNQYKWLVPFGEVELADLPQWVIDLQVNSTPKNKGVQLSLFEVKIKKGRRNSEAAKMAGKILHKLEEADWESVGWNDLLAWNEGNCEPPLDTEELRKVFDSISQRQLDSLDSDSPEDDDEKPSCVTMVLDIIKKSNWGADFFTDQTGKPFVRLFSNGHHEIMSLGSKNFDCLLTKHLHDVLGFVPSKECVASAIKILIANTMGKPKVKLANRVVYHEDAIWYDLTNDDWSTVRIDKEGWQILSPVLPLFYRYAHQKAQIIPISGGDPRKLLEFVNISNPDIQNLFLITLISYFVPSMPHPALIISGGQGSAKSVMCQMAKSLIDPSSLGISAIPEKMESLIQVLAHHWISFFDNVSFLKDETSDLFCKVITGSGFSKRELYSNDGDVIYNLQRSLGINSINNVAIRPDLLERSVIIELEKITEDKRRLEKDLWADFDQALPEILGGIFDTLSKALAIYQDIELPNKPRMADYALWGSAIAEVLGIGQETFLRIYAENQELQNNIAVDENNFATILYEYLEVNDSWKGPANQLMKDLTTWADKHGYHTVGRGSGFPTSPSSLSRKLRTLRRNLEALGMEVILNGPRRDISIGWTPAEMLKRGPQPVKTIPSGLNSYFPEDEG